MNPQVPIGTITSETNSASNCNKFDSIKGTLDIAYRSVLLHGAEKNKIENLGGNHISKMLNLEIMLKLKILGANIL